MIVAAVFISACYILLIGSFAYGVSRTRPYKNSSAEPVTGFSIIVPFRNEAANLPALLAGIAKLAYPIHLFEVILADDGSDDNYEIPDVPFKLTVIRNIRFSRSPKKDAIYNAIAVSQYEWIVTTDADCIVPIQWLNTVDGYIQQQRPDMVAGPVVYNGSTGFLSDFQQAELLSLQGATIGSFAIGRPFMCNGANFAYRKSLFTDLDGFAGNEWQAGGDDVFLLQKAVRSGRRVSYLMSADFIVQTQIADSWRGLFFQRVRWAAKTGSYQIVFGKVTALIVLLGNLNWIYLLGVPLTGTFSPLVLGLLLSKYIIDLVLLLVTAQTMRRRPRSFIISGTLYPFFSTIVALYSLAGGFKWKGRQY